MGASSERLDPDHPWAPCEEGCARTSIQPLPRAIPKTNRAPMGKHVGPRLQACVRDATSCEQLGAADESFNQAIRLGPSSGAL